MMQPGSMLLYGGQVCRMCQPKEETFHGVTRRYYTLRPIYDANSVIYIPADNPKLLGRMRNILSPEEIYRLIEEIPSQETIWIDDDRERSQTYKEILAEGDRRKLVQLVKTLYEHRRELEKKGRKFHAADEAALRQAEQTLYDEFALVLDLQRDQVAPFIGRQIKIQQKNRRDEPSSQVDS